MRQSMQQRIEEYENQVNEKINRNRREEAAYLSGAALSEEDAEFNNHPKVKELAMKLAVSEASKARVAGARGERSGAMRASAEPLEEAAPGQPEASPGLGAATRPDVLSSPYAGAEPRYARQYMSVPGGVIRPDPIERAKPDPKSEAEGAVSPEEADYLPDGPQAVLSSVDSDRKPGDDKSDSDSDARRPAPRPAQPQQSPPRPAQPTRDDDKK